MIKNFVCERLAWALARGASKKTKLLAQGENLLVPDDRTGVISSPGIWLIHQHPCGHPACISLRKTTGRIDSRLTLPKLHFSHIKNTSSCTAVTSFVFYLFYFFRYRGTGNCQHQFAGFLELLTNLKSKLSVNHPTNILPHEISLFFFLVLSFLFLLSFS